MWNYYKVEVLPFGRKLFKTEEELFIQWEPVFSQAHKNKDKTLEWSLKNYKYPNGLPNLTKKIKLKKPYDPINYYFIDEYNDKNNMFWRLETNEGFFCFTSNMVVLPSGEVLKFD